MIPRTNTGASISAVVVAVVIAIMTTLAHKIGAGEIILPAWMDGWAMPVLSAILAAIGSGATPQIRGKS